MPAPSVEKAIQSRLLPRMSFRRGLVIVTIMVLLAWAGRLAWQGSLFPQVVLLTLASLLVLQAIWTLLFFIAWLPAVVARRDGDDFRPANPFAADQLPPQILPPKN